MVCNECGFENKSQASYCEKCGTFLLENKLVCKKCNTINEESNTSCSKCGEPMYEVYDCHNCGEIIEKDTVFCPYCGSRRLVELKSFNKVLKWVFLSQLAMVVIQGIIGLIPQETTLYGYNNTNLYTLNMFDSNTLSVYLIGIIGSILVLLSLLHVLKKYPRDKKILLGLFFLAIISAVSHTLIAYAFDMAHASISGYNGYIDYYPLYWVIMGLGYINVVLAIIYIISYIGLLPKQSNRNFNTMNEEVFSLQTNEQFDLVTYVLLSILTLGIYHFIMVYKISKMFEYSSLQKANPVAEIVLYIFIPFYSVYWAYKKARIVLEEFHKLEQNKDYIITASIVFTILSPILGLVAILYELNDLYILKNKD